MKLRYSVLILCLFAVLVGRAQYRGRSVGHRSDSLSSFVRHYLDSLHCSKARLDSVMRADTLYKSFQNPDGRFARLFVPTMFYHGIISRKFALDPDKSSRSDVDLQVDNALLYIYCHRPDLVLGSQSMLDNIGPLLSSDPTPIATRPNIVDKVAPNPDEPVVEPINLMVKRPNFWKFNGDYYLQFLQNYISGNWYKGGESTFSMLGSVTLQANYNNKQKVKWENKLEMKLGFQTARSDSLHPLKTNNDQIRYTGKLGLQASKHWYYTIQFIAYTQFMRGYNSNSTIVFSDFMSPLNLNLSIGMDYNMNFFKNRLTGSIHLAPLAINYKYVNRPDLAGRYGIDAGHRHKTDYGSEVNIDFNCKLSSMINWRSRLYGFTSYKRSEIEWENTIGFQFNKYISSNLYIFPRFDDSRGRDDHHGYWEFKEYFSVGFTYSM